MVLFLLIEMRNFAFPKTRRLTDPKDFELVKKHGVAQRDKLLLVSVLKTGAARAFCAGFVTSGRIGNAVVRNRLRRRLREIVRKHQHEIITPLWMVTIARQAAVHATFAELEDAWLRLAKRASILAL